MVAERRSSIGSPLLALHDRGHESDPACRPYLTAIGSLGRLTFGHVEPEAPYRADGVSVAICREKDRTQNLSCISA